MQPMGITGIVQEHQARTVGNCMQVNLDRQGITRADSQQALIQCTILLERRQPKPRLEVSL